jgi:type IV pilus assembly protein PilQ
VRQLVAILDQPEPQVEIETRVVIAQRNFSRDLGAQISMSVANPLTGAVASFSTLPQPSLGGGNSGQQEGVAPRVQDPIRDATSRFLGPFQPNGNHSAASPNTVIGLTTGMFGTAQIGLLITAAESRGEAKTVATPRVTALNNRPAQIESGTQIPVQTTQATGGGTTVTTTFVSVPLRLSITPQITDAGTVVLRVTIENNTLNPAIAVGGVPGIDTQRMQTEVLVPDGGTTVMGGVLADFDSNSRQRTPGAASIPILGNLFKRKAITKSSLEILFFITPRIYRPDYFGRPTINTPTQDRGPRTTTVPQPVPLGNPGTNTPTPTELQQPRPTSNPPANQPSGPALSNSPARPSEQK